MKIFLGADHNGFELKKELIDYLAARDHEVIDAGGQVFDAGDDFPKVAESTVKAMRASGDPEARGILICGSGQGMCIAANRFKGIRAGLVWNEREAHAARNDSDSNVLCLPANEIPDFDQITALVEVWLKTPFMGAERFLRRVKQLDELE